MKIGCIALVPWQGGGFVGIQCAKGRGLILPGGKHDKEKDKTYHQTASRELWEQTGLYCEADSLRYLFQGPSITDDYWVIAFLASGFGQLKESTEGKPQRVSRNDLFGSEFVAYYSLLFDALRDRNLHAEAFNYAGSQSSSG